MSIPIDQLRGKALSYRDYFLNKLYGVVDEGRCRRLRWLFATLECFAQLNRCSILGAKAD